MMIFFLKELSERQSVCLIIKNRVNKTVCTLCCSLRWRNEEGSELIPPILEANTVQTSDAPHTTEPN